MSRELHTQSSTIRLQSDGVGRIGWTIHPRTGLLAGRIVQSGVANSVDAATAAALTAAANTPV